jgi:membrane-bound lytic murein transglycosylase F
MNKFLFGVCLLILFSCQESVEEVVIEEEPSAATTLDVEKLFIHNLDSIAKKNTLRVILNNSAISFYVYKGQPMGFQYELAARFAKDNGLNVEVVLADNIDHAMELLISGKGDLIATGLTVESGRAEVIDFTDRVYSTHQCLVQRKPEKWRRMNKHTLNSRMLRDVLDLEDDTVYVKYASSYLQRMQNLSDEIGEKIYVIEAGDSMLAMDLMKEVSKGEIKYTVADQNLATLGAMYFDNLDIETEVSFSQQVAWGIRKNSPELMMELNRWIKALKKSGIRNILYNKYFGNSRSVGNRMESPYTFIKEGQLSPYDDLLKKYAATIHWDWRLLAAQTFKESRFDPKAKSWVGARGLMQLMPRTAAAYRIGNLTDPEQSIKGGTEHIQWLANLFEDKILDSLERQKFIIGSYNVGQGHVFDAQRLAEKYGKDPQKWEDVAHFLLKKSHSKYYNDPVVKYGYCRGIEVVTYVKRIYEIYDIYKGLIEE